MVSPNHCAVLTRLQVLKRLSSSTPGNPSNPSRSTTHYGSLKVHSASNSHVCSIQLTVLIPSCCFFVVGRRKCLMSDNLSSLSCTYILLSSAQAPVPDCKWWMQPFMSSFPRWGTQMCLSHKFLPCSRQQNLPLQLHLQSGQLNSSAFPTMSTPAVIMLFAPLF